MPEPDYSDFNFLSGGPGKEPPGGMHYEVDPSKAYTAPGLFSYDPNFKGAFPDDGAALSSALGTEPDGPLPEHGVVGNISGPSPQDPQPVASEDGSTAFTPPASTRDVVVTMTDGQEGSGASATDVTVAPAATVKMSMVTTPGADTGDIFNVPSAEGDAAGAPTEATLGAPLPAPSPSAPSNPIPASAPSWSPPSRSLWSWFADLYDRAGPVGCFFGVIAVVAVLVLGGFVTASRFFGSPAANSASNTLGGSSTGMVIGTPVTGHANYIERIGTQTFTRMEDITYQGDVLTVNTLPNTPTGGSCITYVKGVSPTMVARTEEIVHLCNGGGTPITTTCEPAFPLFMTSLVLNQPKTFTSTCQTPGSSATSTTQTYTDDGTITLTNVLHRGTATYVVVKRQYSRMYSATSATTINFTETSVYRLDRWQEIGTTTTSTLGSSTSSSQFALQGAPSAALALLPAPPASSSGSTNGTPTNGSSNVGGPFVIIAFNQLSFGTAQQVGNQDLCKTGGTLYLGVTINGIAPGTPVQIRVSGPGVFQLVEYKANPGQEYTRTFPFPPGGGQWSDNILSIGDRNPPSSGSHVVAPIQCVT
ncbi:MAG TPA: hypothetical protein VF137_12520 [Candidatus Dormibacteraeota bacterium]